MSTPNYTPTDPTDLVRAWITSDPILMRIASDIFPFGVRTLESAMRAVVLSFVREGSHEDADIELICGLLDHALKSADWSRVALSIPENYPPPQC